MELKETVKSHTKRSEIAGAPRTDSRQSAIKLLKSQHREVEHLFSELEAADATAYRKKERLFSMLSEKVISHVALEEEILYPASIKADKDMTLEALEEHANIKTMLQKIANLEDGDETYNAKIKVLNELISHHVKEEEEELFPKCEKALGGDLLEELGREMAAKAKTDAHLPSAAEHSASARAH